jgi:hypothetical protein
MAWLGVPRVVANSRAARPLVGLYNELRLRTYFAVDERCLADLTASGMPYVFVADPPNREACPLHNVVRALPGGLLSRPLYMTCRLARALRRFDQEVVQPAAQRHLQQPVARLDELGVRNCRTVEGYDALMSEHAYANAIDVAAFVLADGTAIAVTEYRDAATPRAAFLRDVTERACDVFRTVLGPGFDERHGAHLHLDMGLIGGCHP